MPGQYFDPYTARNTRAGMLNYSPQAQSAIASAGGDMAQTAGSTLTTAGMIPSPASPFLMAGGLALQAGGALWNAYSESKDKKRAKEVQDREWALTRAKILQEMEETRKKSDWKAGFARALYRPQGGQ